MPGYQGPIDEPNRNRINQQSALSGDDNLGELPGLYPERDVSLKEKILTHLWSHPEINTSGIRISVKDGFVSLTGVADSIEDRGTIQALVEAVSGVEDVASFIELDHSSVVGKSLSGDTSIGIPSPS